MYLHHPFLWNLILLIEDSCIKYKALHNLERLMIGDFLANKNYIVTRQADIVTFLPLSHSLQTFTVTVTEAVLDHCLHNDLLFLLHHTSVSVYDLKSQSWRDKIIMIADKLVSIKVNDHVMVILDTTNTLHIFNLKGISLTLYNVWILMIFLFRSPLLLQYAWRLCFILAPVLSLCELLSFSNFEQNFDDNFQL